MAAKKRTRQAKKRSGKPKTKSAFEFVQSYLKKNRKATFSQVRDAAAKKKLTVYPVVYGRVQAIPGIVKPRRGWKGKAAVAKKRAARRARGGRQKASGARGSKSERVRGLLDSGLSGPEIAKRVGCSVNLVYAVKAQNSAPSARVRKRRQGKTSKAPALDQLVNGVKELERERDQLRAALEKIRDAIDAVR